MASSSADDNIAQAQSESLDDTDCYASVWEEILDKQKSSAAASGRSLWGGRGKGGRGLARRTVQSKNIVVHDVRLQYLGGDVCLDGTATIKLLSGHVYALIGRNGCGKTTVMQRMNEQKIPGWSITWSSIYVPSEIPNFLLDQTPLQVILYYCEKAKNCSTASTKSRIHELEDQLDQLEEEEEDEEQKQQDKLEAICEELSILEDQLESDQASIEQNARDALLEFGIIHQHQQGDDDGDDSISSSSPSASCQDLSRGQRKRILLASAWVCSSFVNLLLLDEPTIHLDVLGLIQLRRLITEVVSSSSNTTTAAGTSTVVLVSHDVDLINDVATDIIDMDSKTLTYYPGNYDSYRLMKSQQESHDIRKSINLEKKKERLKGTLHNLKSKPVPRRQGGSKKKGKAVASQRKKIEKLDELVEKTNNNNNATAATNTNTKNRRLLLTAAERLKLVELLKTIPDKAVQFNFTNTTSVWGEPLITALDVGHGFRRLLDEEKNHSCNNNRAPPPFNDNNDNNENNNVLKITKKDGFLFDCVDLCIEEGSKTCILGPTASGKSTLMKILAKRINNPIEGTVHHASGIRLGYYDLDIVNSMVSASSLTPLDYLVANHPQRTEHDIRAQLTSFGISPQTAATTQLCYLSGGEKCRFVLAAIMMDEPQVLCLDNPTSHLDVESVQALVYGLRQWNGTLVLVSQDFHFLRSLESVNCAVIVPEEGKLRRVHGGIDSYLKWFKL